MSEAIQKIETAQPSILEIISSVAANPNVDADKLGKLLEIQLQIMEQEKTNVLNAALARLEPKLKTLTKSKAGAATKGGQVKFWYAPWEDIDRMLRPELRECGLFLSFTTRAINDKPYYVARVQEVTKGGIGEAVIPYVPDANDQLGAPQKVASGLSYAKRVSVAMLFNLTFEGDDDNAQFAGAISAAEVGKIERLLTERDVDRVAFADYLEKECGVRDVALIPGQAFKEIESKLLQKKTRK